MATLTGKKISDSYKDLLQVSNSNAGVDGTLRDIEDGEGTASVLQISSSSINIKDDGALQINETAVTSTAAELNILDGVTSSTAELNLLDGVTATTAEINYLDGVTSNIQTQLDSKVTGFRTVEVDTNGDDSANETLGASETLRFKKGSNITLSESSGVITIASTDTNTQLSNAEVRTAVEAASDSNVFTDADHSKLDGIEASADVTDATNVTAAGALMDSELSSIADVKALDQSVISGASPTFGTANMSDASNKRFMTDAQETKLDSVESNADVTDATNVTAAGALMDSEVTNLSFVKGLTSGISSGNVLVANANVADNDFLKIDGTSVEGRTAAEVRSDLNVEDGATADQTASDIRGLGFFDTSNDGATSGLDSDLLDGQHGSYYLDFGNFVIDDDEIPIAKLASDNVSYGGVTLNLGGTDATPAFDLSDATSLPIVAGTTGTLSVARGGTGATSLNNLITLTTHTTGNYVAAVSGTSNEIEVSGSGSEGATVTVGLPDDVTIGRDLVVTRNLTVSGTTTTINTDEVNIADNQIILNSDYSGSSPTESAGIEVERGTQTNKSLQWNETDDKWTVGSETFVAGTFEGNLSGTVSTATQGTIDHDSLANFVANEHIDHTSITLTAGNGLTGGGTIAANRTFAVGAGTGITVNANDIEVEIQGTSLGSELATGDLFLYADTSDSNNVKSMDIGSIIALAPQGDITSVVAGSGLTGGSTSGDATINIGAGTGISVASDAISTDDSAIVHDNLSGFVANEHIDHSGVTLTAGDGMTGGGTIASSRTFNVVGGTGITANANDIELDINGLTLAAEVATTDLLAIYDGSATDVRKITIADLPFTNNSGDITQVTVTAGTGLSGGGTATSGGFSATLALDFSELTDMTGDISGTTEFILQDGTTESRKAASEIKLSNFNNDSGFTSNTGDITSVVAGAGMTGGATSGDATLNVIAGDGINVNANDVEVDIQGTSLASEVATNDLVLMSDTSDSNNVKSIDMGSIVALAPQGDITAVVAGTNLSGGGTTGSVTLNVDDAFLKNDANDTTTGTITAAGFTTAGSLTLGGHAVNDIDLGGEFNDVDDHLMTSAAINDRITSFGYTTNTGDITAVVAGTGISGGATSGSATVNLDINGLTVASEANASDTVGIYDASATAVRKITLQDIIDLGTAGDITGVTAGDGLTGGGSSGGVSLAVGAGNLIDVQANQVDVDLSELTTSTSDGDGDFFAVIDSSNNQKKLTKGNINISGFNNDSGFTTNTGDITGVTAGNGLSGGGSSGGVTLNLDINGTTLLNESPADDDEFIIYDTSAGALRKVAASDVGSQASGDITGVTAGSGLTGGGSSGGVTLNVGAGALIDVAADTVAVDLSELTDGTGDIVGSEDELVYLDNGSQKRKLVSEIKLSQFNNDSGFTSNSGDITGVTAGTALSGGGSSGSVTLNLDIAGTTVASEVATNDTILITDTSNSSAIRQAAISDLPFTNNSGDITGVTAGNALTGGGTSGAITINHEDTSSQSSVNNSGRTYIQDITLDTYGHVTGITSATETVTNTDTNTNQLTTFQLEDGDGTEVTVSHAKEVKFVEGGRIDINWTDTSNGTDGDPYDLTFTVDNDLSNYDNSSSGFLTAHPNISAASTSNNSGRTYIQDITLDSNGHVTGIATATETVTNTDTNTNQLTTFQLEDGDGTEVTIAHGKEIKFVEGGGIDINFTDTSTGSDGDPFDLTFTVSSQTDNNFTDADHSKLDGIEASADVTDTSNVTSAGALMDSECTNLSAVKGINQALTTSSDVTFASVDADTIDVSGDLTLDADGADIILKDGGTEYGRLTNFLGGLTLKTGSSASNGLIFSADGTTMITGGSIQMSGGFVLDGNTITGVDDSGEFTNDDAHIMTSAAVEDKILGYGYTSNTGNVTSGSTVDFNNVTCDQIGVNVSANGTDGRIDAGNDIVAFSSSDKRLKENIKPLDNALDKVSKISGVEFDWKPLTKEEKKTIHGNEGHDVGVIAQEIEEVLPEVVQTRDTGYKAVKYEKIVPLLIEAIKELKEEIEELKK